MPNEKDNEGKNDSQGQQDKKLISDASLCVAIRDIWRTVWRYTLGYASVAP